jgi:hypothetical protein
VPGLAEAIAAALPHSTPVLDSSDDLGELYTLDEGNRWLFSHQPALWDREFLLSILKDGAGENPWMNELMGSQRAQLVHAAFAYLPTEWYIAVSDSGSLKPAGQLMAQHIQQMVGPSGAA